MIALVCVGLMLIGKAVEWDDIIKEKGAWDTLVWMGSLMALATALNKLGLIKWGADLVAGSLAGVYWMTSLGILLAVFMWSHYAFASLSAHAKTLQS